MAFQVRTTDLKVGPISAQITELVERAALVLALKKMLIFWLVAVGCVLIPVLHFFLVPTFFGLGIYMFVRTSKYKFKLVDLKFKCPGCQKDIYKKELFMADEYPFYCESCGVQLRIDSSESVR